MPVLYTENLSHLYSLDTPFETTAISDVSVAFEEGEFVGIIGHTGSGKSTLISHLNGLLKPTSGKVFLNGVDIWSDKIKIRDVRFKVGLCFQYPEYQLFEDTVYKDISFGPKNMGLNADEIDKRVQSAARFVGLPEALLSKSPFDLSGGEKRRAAIAGVMAMEPTVLILDEPTAGLDPKGRDTILGMLREFHQDTRRTVIIVSHSMEDIAAEADRIIVMNESHVVMTGAPGDIFSRSEELLRIGLGIPQITKVFMGLKKRGIPVRDTVYTPEQGRDEILRLIKSKKTGATEKEGSHD